MEKRLANAAEIKRYFDYKTMQEFKADWVRLTPEEKEFFKEGVGALLPEAS